MARSTSVSTRERWPAPTDCVDLTASDGKCTPSRVRCRIGSFLGGRRTLAKTRPPSQSIEQAPAASAREEPVADGYSRGQSASGAGAIVERENLTMGF